MSESLPVDFDWEQDDDFRMARANFMACAYNAAVNYGTDRGARKMADLIRAINLFERVEGRVKLERLVRLGVIENFTPCPGPAHSTAFTSLYDDQNAGVCLMRPGGLRHADGCENDSNHPVSKARQQRAREMLPGGRDGNAGWRAASVHLVGRPSER